MNLPKRKESEPQQIQLELPDYSQAYWEWKRKKDQEANKTEETVAIIDIY